MEETLCALVHGEPGHGKSWLAQTCPAPRLILDAEGGSRRPKRMGKDGKVEKVPFVKWDPCKDPPPEPGEWETCLVIARDFLTIKRAYEWLNSGQHPFKSVGLDSLTEIQKRCKDALAGGETPTERQWGDLLIQMEGLVRQFRDLVFHPVNPLDVVLILALSVSKLGGKYKPAVQGALGVSLPGYVDLEGCLIACPNEDGEMERRLLITPHPSYEAKDRTHYLSEHYGSVIVNPDVERMLAIINEMESE